MRKIALSIFSLLFLGALGACHTMEGFGKDVKKVGEKVETAAKRKE